MKKIVTMLMLCAVTTSLYACSKGKKDKNDTENYIGAAEVGRVIAKILDISTKDMSSFKIVDDKAIMEGIISKDTIRQVKKLISNYPKVKTIVMQNVKGSIDDESNLIASRLVRKAGLNTHVSSDGFIASGGTDFFCAGLVRTVEVGGKVGVHSWAGDGVDNAALLKETDKSHEKYISYYEAMSMPDPKGFYFFTINAAVAKDMYYMTQEELKMYGLVSEE